MQKFNRLIPRLSTYVTFWERKNPLWYINTYVIRTYSRVWIAEQKVSNKKRTFRLSSSGYLLLQMCKINVNHRNLILIRILNRYLLSLYSFKIIFKYLKIARITCFFVCMTYSSIYIYIFKKKKVNVMIFQTLGAKHRSNIYIYIYITTSIIIKDANKFRQRKFEFFISRSNVRLYNKD